MSEKAEYFIKVHGPTQCGGCHFCYSTKGVFSISNARKHRFVLCRDCFMALGKAMKETVINAILEINEDPIDNKKYVWEWKE